MPDELLAWEKREYLRLLKFYKKAPAQFAKAAGHMLNDFAFGTRNTSIEVIRERMVVRSPKFVERRLYVDKSHTRAPIESQRSEVGSTAFKRFSGWKEQQLGTKTAREKTINLLARGGKNRKRKVAGPARLKRETDFKSYHEYPGSGVEQKNIIMLQRLDRERYKRPFFILGKRGMRPGLYKFWRRKPRLLQIFDPPNPQPKRIPWLTDATARYFQRENVPRLWRRKLSRMLRKYKR